MRLDEDAAVASIETAGPVLLSSLRDALIRYLRDTTGESSGKARLRVSPLSERQFDPDYGIFERVEAIVDGGELFVQVETWQAGENSAASVEPVLAPLLKRHEAEFISEDVDAYEDAQMITVRLRWPFARRTVAQMLHFGKDVEALLDAAGGGELVAWSALDLLRGGRWDLFRGQPESSWLDAKRAPYDSNDANWRFELAKDVASFANSPDGGLIVLGMTARDDGDGETINGYRELDLHTVRRQAYRNVVAQHIYPRVEGFQVERIDGQTKGRGLVVLVIPPQQEVSRPFLVRGLIRDGSVLGAHLLLPIRREDETALMDISAVHARLRLGEQVISGQLLRGDRDGARTPT